MPVNRSNALGELWENGEVGTMFHVEHKKWERQAEPEHAPHVPPLGLTNGKMLFVHA
jgi:hypothetical protein